MRCRAPDALREQLDSQTNEMLVLTLRKQRADEQGLLAALQRSLVDAIRPLLEFAYRPPQNPNRQDSSTIGLGGNSP